MNTVHLEKYLKVGLPEDLDITFQIVSEFSEDREVICDWDGEKLSYILSADSQPGGYEHKHYWNSMEQALKTSSDSKTFKVLKSGCYKTKIGEDVSFRVYRRSALGEDEVHIYHLISNDQIAYWALATLVNISDIFLVNSEISKIMETAELVS